jgi:hypothetical protein
VGNICCKLVKEEKRMYGSNGKTRRKKRLRKHSGRWEGDVKWKLKQLDGRVWRALICLGI